MFAELKGDGSRSGAAEHSVSAKGSLTLTYVNGGGVRLARRDVRLGLLKANTELLPV